MARPSTFKKGFTIKEPDYNASHPEQLYELLKQGCLDCEIYAAMGLKKDTFYRWRREHKDFQDAFELGISHCEAFYARHAKIAMQSGDDKGFKYFIGIMNNKFGWGKDEGRPVTQNTINIQGNMNLIQQKTNQELIELVTSNMEYLESNNVLPTKTIETISDGSKQKD